MICYFLKGISVGGSTTTTMKKVSRSQNNRRQIHQKLHGKPNREKIMVSQTNPLFHKEITAKKENLTPDLYN